jgi:asparagine synthase (glutamine-hydrolysing)
VKFDRMSMAHSLEGRAPYLSPHLAELALRGARPWSRMSLTDSKRALRRVARNWLPRDILERPKQGFVLPMRRWLKQWFDSHGGVQAYFSARPLPSMDMPAAIDMVEQDVARDIQRERLLFALVMLAEWSAASSQSLAQARRAGKPAAAQEAAAGASV